MLYLSYDGMLEPLGESQVVSYLERLAADWSVTLISFEKNEIKDTARLAAMRARLERAEIRWLPRRYHRQPRWLAKVFDVVAGAVGSLRWAFEDGPGTIHARGYLPALMSLLASRTRGTRFVFDIRGFWADERVDRGHWSHGSVAYRTAKWWERRFFESADAIVSLTHAGVRSFPELGYRLRANVVIRVIPTCVDLDRFCPGPKAPRLLKTLGLGNGVVIGCIGSMSRAYMRTEMLQYLALLIGRFDAARILVVTREDHDALRADAARAGVDVGRLVLVSADHSEMPELIRLIDVGVFFIRPSFSARACAATKLGELLATGIPVVTNAGIGDYAELVSETITGIVLQDVSRESLDASIEPLRRLIDDPATRLRCREAATRYFDVNAGAREYASLYDAL